MSGILQMVFAATSGSGPINTVAPVVTGTAQVRQTLSCTQGTWVSPTPISGYAYQWQHGTTNIPGATSSSYTISYLYSGETIRCVVTATSESGSTGFPSASTSAVAITTPLAPTIGTATSPTNTSGLVQFVPNPDNGGSVVTSYTATSTPGSLTGTAAGTPITVNGLTTGTYYAFTVRATNSAGNSPESGFSNDILPGASPPVNISAPSLSGTAQARNTLYSTTGSWTGTPTPTYSYQWQSNGGADIPGETGSSILIPSAYYGSNIRCKVTATNAGGAVAAYTAYSSTVTANTPATPTGVYAYPNGDFSYQGDPRVTVDWTIPDNGGLPITGYETRGYRADTGTLISVGFPTLPPDPYQIAYYDVNFYYTVMATNALGDSSQSSASNTVFIARPVVSAIIFLQAGGGAGGSNGGGGGGGGGQVALTSHNLAKGTNYVIAVGSGGASVASGTGGNGGSSFVSGSNAPPNAIGGGGGGKVSVIGNSGGSGGGSGGSAGLSPVAAGTPGQGRDGGGTGYNTGGGGGGVNNDGGSPISASYGGGGAPGAAFSSTPFNLPRCGSGGGGGGGTTGGNAWEGAGGGGAAGTAGSAASPFYGGGGGGGGRTTARGGNGGSGIIVMAVLTSDYSGSVTGATVTTNAGYTIMEFYTTGTYTV